MKINNNFANLPVALSFDDVLLVPKKSSVKSRSEVDLSTQINSELTLKIPVIATNMDTVTGVEMAVRMSELGGMALLPRFEPIEAQTAKVKEVVNRGGLGAASIGIKEGLKRAEALVESGATVLNIDVAHGHMQQNLDFTKEIRERFEKGVTIISGIAATAECAEDLYKAGADCVFVGIGGGSICTTRIQTGCGLPTFESLLRIQAIARHMGKTYIPCAGVRNSGDIVKSLAAGASAVSLGSLLAGTLEAPGELLEINGKYYKSYNGSTSAQEKNKHLERVPDGKSKAYSAHIEGVEALVEYKGEVGEVVEGLLAGIRSGFSYCGVKNLKDLWEIAEFVRTTPGGIKESGAHDIIYQ